MRNNLEADTWIVVFGQHGAFDAVHIVSRTYTQTASTWILIIDSLLRKLNDLNSWTHVEFMLVRAETGRSRRFRLDTSRGGLRQCLSFDEQEWDRRDYRNNVIHRFLEWTEG